MDNMNLTANEKIRLKLTQHIKEGLLNNTNIKNCPEEMLVLDKILFRLYCLNYFQSWHITCDETPPEGILVLGYVMERAEEYYEFLIYRGNDRFEQPDDGYTFKKDNVICWQYLPVIPKNLSKIKTMNDINVLYDKITDNLSQLKEKWYNMCDRGQVYYSAADRCVKHIINTEYGLQGLREETEYVKQMLE